MARCHGPVLSGVADGVGVGESMETMRHATIVTLHWCYGGARDSATICVPIRMRSLVLCLVSA